MLTNFKIFVLIIATSLTATLRSQSKIDTFNNNGMHLEFLGSSLIFYSLHYERSVWRRKSLAFKLSAGFHYKPFSLSIVSNKSIGYNIESKMEIIRNRKSLLFGIGYTYLFFYDDEYSNSCCSKFNFLITRIERRIYSKNKNRYWSLSLTPIILLDKHNEPDPYLFLPSFGLQYGWSF